MISLQSTDSIRQTLGGRLRTVRLARNLSQHDLAGMTGASLSSVRRLEATGQGTLDLLVRVALALQVTQALDSLFLLPTHTIAQADAAATVARRQRARRPAPAVGSEPT